MASSGTFGVNNTLIRMSIDGTDVSTSGNTKMTSTSGSWGTPLTLAATTGKWYIEYYVNTGSSGRNVMVVPTNSLKYQQANYNFPVAGDYGIILNSSGAVYNNSDTSATQTGITALQTGDIMGVAMNLDASPKTVQFYRNGTAAGTAENINTSATGHFTFMNMGHNATTMTVNSGQDSSFAGAKSTGTANAADDNGFGDFYYTPPSGFLAMCTANLPVDSNVDPAETDDNHPQKQFGVVTFTGNGTARTISGLGFQPDFIWGKRRNSTRRHYLVDSSRGFTKYLHAEGNYSEGTSSDGVTSATTDGFAIGGSLDYINANTDTYVAWCWRANGGTTATNTDGTITSTVQANQAAGFSIMQWAGDNSQNATIGHGLGGIPDVWIVKDRDATANWRVGFNTTAGAGFASLSGDHSAVKLNNTDAAGDLWRTEGNFTATATTCNTPNNGNSAAFFTTNGNNFIGYCWRSIEGFSKFGLYTGNGNADGPFVYTGFRPRLMVQKRIDSTGSWRVWDSERHTFNPNDAILRWEGEDAEDTANGVVDFLSNGFKIRMTYADMNANSGTFVYMCWGDSPFKYNQTF